MGGALLQRDINRDTQKFAFKCSWATVNGKEIDVYKEPITDAGKNSKRGKLDLVEMSPGEIKTVNVKDGYPNSRLDTVYENGQIKKLITFDEVRANSNKPPYTEYKGWMDKEV